MPVMMEVSPLKRRSRGVFGSGLRETVIRAIQGVGNSMQFDVYDPFTGDVGRLAKMASLRTELSQAVCDQAMDSGREAKSVDPSEVRFLDFFVAPYKQCPEKPRMLAEIARDDVGEIFKAGVRMGTIDSNGKISLESVAVRTVFGATEHMPVRAVSYLLPGLHLLESLRRSRRFSTLPQIQYISMGENGSRINNLDRDTVSRQANVLAGVGMRYVERFYPELADSVTFAYDNTFLDNPEVLHYKAQLQGISEAVGTHVSEYALLHPLVHDMRYTEEPFTPMIGAQSLRDQPDLVINVGGQTEKLFYGVRRMYLDTAKQEGVDMPTVRSVQLFTTNRMPPYMSIAADGDHLGDIHFDDAFIHPDIVSNLVEQLAKDGHVNNLLARDYKVLDQDSCGGFHDFFQDVASELSGTAA